MAELEMLQSLFDQVSDARSKLKLLREQMEEMDDTHPLSKKSKTTPGVEKEVRNYEHSAQVLSKETELLRSGVIEELPGDDGIQYFLAIAEMQKNITNFRELKQMGERILGDNLQHAKMIEQIDKEWKDIEGRLNEEMERNKNDKDNENNVPSALENEADKEKAAIRELNTKINRTKSAYKHIKSEFGNFLQRAVSKEWTPFCSLLQELWNTYANNLSNNSSDYLRISHLDFDVSQSDIHKLISEGLVLVHPDDPDQIKLIEFKR